MSQAQVEQFANRVKNDPAMFQKLVAGTQTPEQFVEKAAALGKETGYSFTKEEADGWVQQQISAKQSGELTDFQLESVAGGKGSDKSATDAILNASDTFWNGLNDFNNSVIGAMNSANNWMNSWMNSW